MFFKAIKPGDRVIIGLTGVIALAAIASDVIFFKQLGAMDGQLDDAKAGRRAWLSVEVAPDGPVTFFQARRRNGSTYIVGSLLRLKVSIKNVGQSPAFNVRPSFVGWVEGVGVEPEAEQEILCGNLRKMKSNNPASGFVIFPGESNPGNPYTNNAGFEPDQIAKGLARNPGGIGLSVIGCVDYLSGVDRTHHQTGFVYTVSQIVPRPGMDPAKVYAFVPGATVSAGQLIFDRSPSSSRAD